MLRNLEVVEIMSKLLEDSSYFLRIISNFSDRKELECYKKIFSLVYKVFILFIRNNEENK